VPGLSRKLIIEPDSLVGADGANINGPSLIATPDWLPNRLGRFYLYFAHHHGEYIRLAYADTLDGPWRIHGPGTLRLADAVGCYGHIASPDVHVDHNRRQIRMYFHGFATGANRQLSFLATSNDGLNFVARQPPIASSYLRALPWRDCWLGMASGGLMYVSKTGLDAFQLLRQPAFGFSDPAVKVRHVALRIVGDDLQVYFTRVGDKPERIFRAHIDLREPANRWRARDAKLVLAPETAWEGADQPVTRSKAGAAVARENALRDPAIFEHGDRIHLLYSVAGESGIGLADITDFDQSAGHAAIEAQAVDALLPEPLKTESPATAKPDVAGDGRRPASLQTQLDWLSQPGNLDSRLDELDKKRPLRRVFVMGCGRSGTWLLAAVMTTFHDTTVAYSELSVEHFGLLSPDSSTLVLKRAWHSHMRVEDVPQRIGIAYIVRHPYDVLTSHNPATGRAYHVMPQTWLMEMNSLQYMVHARRANTKIIRYEDLVSEPDDIQASLGSFFHLKISSSVNDIPKTFNVPAPTAAAMHGVRPIDRRSVNRHKSNPAHIDYLRAIRPGLGETLEWVSHTFDYDLSL
jgi:hypothetical protein